jgi:ABC-type transport system involved in Fe-S cluster assembly fused permease/ATPase subunit
VTVSEEEITALCKNNNILYGKVTVTSKPSKMQVQFDVALRRNPLVAVTSDTLFLVQDQKDNVIISAHENVRSAIKDIKFRYYDEDDSSVLCDLQRIDDTSYQAVISFSPNPHSRHQLIRFDVEFENGMKDSAIVLASLKNNQ